MNTAKRILTAGVTGALLALAAAPALAASATAHVNVRTGPGTSHQKVDVLSPGENVDIRECRSGWCYVTHSGPDGWVSANYLTRDTRHGRPSGGSASNESDDPNVNFSFGIGPDGPSFGFSIGEPTATAEKPRACFYANQNYSGRSFCVEAGKSVRRIPSGWDDRISSVRLIGDASSVTMCRDPGYDGYCRSTDRDQPYLGRWLDDEISSVRVR